MLKPAEDGPNETLRIVLVENDDDDVFFMERALRRAQLHLSLTRLKDGQHAIDYFSQLQDGVAPDVVMLDVNMPRRNGFEVLRWLREQPSFARLPVMMLTSSDDPFDISRAKDLGAAQFLTKKASCTEVVEALKRFRPSGEAKGVSSG